MKRIVDICVATGMILGTGCDRTVVVDRPAAQVVQAIESLVPSSIPPNYRTTVMVPGEEWTVLITENVPGRKFEHYAITFHIVKAGPDRTQIAVSAERVSSLPMSPRIKEPRIARQYMARLASEAMKKQSQQNAAPLPSAPAGPSEGAR